MSERIGNASLELACAFCNEKYPRMYRLEGTTTIVCKLGGKCRNGKEQKVAATKNKPLADVEKTLKVRIGDQMVGRIDIAAVKDSSLKDYRAFIAHPELGFEQVGVANDQAGALKLIGNAIMRKLWEV